MPWDEAAVEVADDPPGPPESHDPGCLCGACFRRCLGDDPPWWAPYRLAALADPEDAARLAEHERLVATGMWLAQQTTHRDPPGWAAVLAEALDRLADRCEVTDD